jgi:hypothetical protein
MACSSKKFYPLSAILYERKKLADIRLQAQVE